LSVFRYVSFGNEKEAMGVFTIEPVVLKSQEKDTKSNK
jgi:hypothetical protein